MSRGKKEKVPKKLSTFERHMRRVKEGYTPKCRTLDQLLDIYDAITRASVEAARAAAQIRSQIYPEECPKEYKFHTWDQGIKAAFFTPRRGSDSSELTLALYDFGYSQHQGKTFRSWSIDWFTGLDDLKLWEQAHPKEKHEYGSGDMEKLAWLGDVERLAWFGGGNLLYTGYNERTAVLALEHYNLECRERQLRDRTWPVIREIERIFQDQLREEVGNDYFHASNSKQSPTRVFLGDRTIATYKEGRLQMYDEYAEVRVPGTAKLKRDGAYGYKNNGDLRHHLQQLQERRERNNR